MIDRAVTVPGRPAVAAAATGVATARRRIAQQHAAGAPGIATATFAADLFEQIVIDLWSAVLADLPEATAAAVARSTSLVALGGFGRREMAPYSDIDVMLLHDGSDRPALAQAASRFLQDLYDAGLEAGQSVRTPGEAARLAQEDATILASLLDARPLVSRNDQISELASRPDHFQELASRPDHFQELASRPDHFQELASRLDLTLRRRPRLAVERLVAARRDEAIRFGQTVALLEPNVKRSRGGLRDIQLIRWLGRVLAGADASDPCAIPSGLPRSDATDLREALEFLTRVRIDLHLATARASDDLTREHQKRLAAAHGLEDQAGLLGVERFMQDYFRHTRRVARAVETRLEGSRRPGPLRRLASRVLGHRVEGIYRVGPTDVAAVPGEVARVTGSTAAVLRLVELSLLYSLPVETATWEAVREAVPALPRTVDRAANQAFLALLSHADGLAPALRSLHEAGVLEILLPPFGPARHLLQFNNYHKYTVDEHCILAVERVTDLAHDRSWLGATWRRLSRRRPLLLALLLHDLGKGVAGDHSEVGATMAHAVAERLELPADEAELVEFLVRKHLAMAHLAFRRDTGDDSLLARFARDVGSPEVLSMMALLTAADMAAVGPGVWTQWKAEVLGEVYFRTLAILDGATPTLAAEHTRRELDTLLERRDADDPVVRLARRLPASYLRDTPAPRIIEELGRLARLQPPGGQPGPLAGHGHEAFALARWQPASGTVAITVGTLEHVASGVFHRVTGALTAERLEILSADIHTLEGGAVLDHFTVLDPDYAGEPPAERLADVAAAIRSALRADRAPEFKQRWNPFAPQNAPAALQPVVVRFDNASSRQDTILEVFAHDAPGLLYSIARAIFQSGLSVKAAKIGTYLDQVVDAFHLVDEQGAKVTDPQRLTALREAIEAVTAPPGPS
jgi:[protein-PII] uridylyltransferase